MMGGIPFISLNSPSYNLIETAVAKKENIHNNLMQYIIIKRINTHNKVKLHLLAKLNEI